jgi:uncharacterized membrane protein
METRNRSIAKAMSFRILATITTFAMVWVLTGNLEFAGLVGGIDFISKLILFYFHERAWNKIKWGKN